MDSAELAAAVTGIENAIVEVAGLQATGGAKGVDLDAIRVALADAVDGDPAEAGQALSDIRKTLDEALGIEQPAVEETGDAVEEAAVVMQAQLDAAEAQVEQLSGDLAEKLAEIDALNDAIATLDAKAGDDAKKLDELQTQLAAAEAQAQAQAEALADAEAEAQAQAEAMADAEAVYEKQIAEANAYKVERAPATGEAHLSTTVDNAIEVAADGVTASWQYANSDLSGNEATIQLLLDGEAIYTSGALKPGEALEDIVLEKPLPAGSHQAIAVTTVYDKDGAPVLTTRVPVTINVAE